MKRFVKLLIYTFTILSITSVYKTETYAHTFSNFIYINNELLVKDYNGPESTLLNSNTHYIDKPFSLNQKINFKIRLSEMGFASDLVCKAKIPNYKIVDGLNYEVNYPGIELYVKGVEFNLEFDESGSYTIEFSCTKVGDDREYLREFVSFKIGEDFDFPASLLVNNKEVLFKSTAVVKEQSKVSIKIKEPSDRYRYSWDIIGNGNLVQGDKLEHRFMLGDEKYYVVLRILDTKTNIYKDDYFIVEVVENKENHNIIKILFSVSASLILLYNAIRVSEILKMKNVSN